jgi:hypothetical protein
VRLLRRRKHKLRGLKLSKYKLNSRKISNSLYKYWMFSVMLKDTWRLGLIGVIIESLSWRNGVGR